MLRDQSVDLAAKLREFGVPVELEVWPKVWHVWHLSADMLPEARTAILKLAEFARRHLRLPPQYLES
jgi:acetyl esterase/lipase